MPRSAHQKIKWVSDALDAHLWLTTIAPAEVAAPEKVDLSNASRQGERMRLPILPTSMHPLESTSADASYLCTCFNEAQQILYALVPS